MGLTKPNYLFRPEGNKHTSEKLPPTMMACPRQRRQHHHQQWYIFILILWNFACMMWVFSSCMPGEESSYNNNKMMMMTPPTNQYSRSNQALSFTDEQSRQQQQLLPLSSLSLLSSSSSQARTMTTASSYNFTVAICSAVKDSEAYLQEWIDYHLLAMDFQNIYLYDNSDTFTLQAWYNHTRTHPIYSRVEVIHYPGRWIEEKHDFVQHLISTDCVRRFGVDPKGPQHDYLAFFDDDEFAVLQNTSHYTDIRGVLADYLVPFHDGGALTVNWMLIGTANHSTYTPLPVTKRFQYRDAVTHNVIKSIVASKHFVKMLNPHGAKVKYGSVVYTTKYPGCKFQEASKTRASDPERPSDIMLLYHYRYNSLKEYYYKRCVRGNIGHAWCDTTTGQLRSQLPDHVQPRPGEIFDDQAWKFLTAKVPVYKLYDAWEDFT